jgi:hypothetical protein
MGIARPKPGPGGRISYEQRWAYVIGLSLKALGMSRAQWRAANAIVCNSFSVRLRALVQDRRWANLGRGPHLEEEEPPCFDRDLEFAEFYLDNVEQAVIEFVDELMRLLAPRTRRLTPQQGKAVVALAVRLGNRLRDRDCSYAWFWRMAAVSIIQPSREASMWSLTDCVADDRGLVSLEKYGSSRANTRLFRGKVCMRADAVYRMEGAARRRLNLRHVLLSAPVSLPQPKSPFKRAVREVMQKNMGATQKTICEKVDEHYRHQRERTMIPESWHRAGAQDMLSAFKNRRLHGRVKTFLSKIAPEALI